MKPLLSLVVAIIFFCSSFSVSASEQINDFDVTIDVQKDGDVIITEVINITSEGNQIRRGIFRDLPRYYQNGATRLPFKYDVNRIERDGRKEPYDIERTGNAFRIRIGDADVFLENGIHEYKIEYEVKNQVRYFSSYDEIYWNATGNYWNFPITKATARVRLPDGAVVTSNAAYTGVYGVGDLDYTHQASDGFEVFKTNNPLQRSEGLTVAVGFEKGAVDPPSAADRRADWWAMNAAMVVLAGAIGLLGTYYFVAFNRVGRDPLKGPVFPRYEPPAGYSPAAVHHIFHRRISGHDAMIATVLNYAVRDGIKIDAKDKKKTTLTFLGAPKGGAKPEEEALINGLFNGRSNVTLGDGYDSAVTSAYTKFHEMLAKAFGEPYFKWNVGFLIAGIALSVVAVVIAANLAVTWTLWHTISIVVLGVLAAAFSYFIPAPTDKGQKTRTEIEGFRLYLETAEKLQLNAAQPGSDAPPMMSVERYERFLPFAVALGVEKPWTKHFEKLIPEEAQEYQPRWTSMHSGRHHSLHGLNSALVAAMSSGVTSALPQSSSSSGSGGGGFSGGGGGGGGGGGW